MDKLQSAVDRFKEQCDAMPVPPRLNASQSAVPPVVIYSRTRSIVTPDEILRRHRILTGRDSSQLSNACRVLRTQVIHRLRENK